MTHKHSQNGRKVWYRSHPALFSCLLFCLSFCLILRVGLGKVVAIETSALSPSGTIAQAQAQAQVQAPVAPTVPAPTSPTSTTSSPRQPSEQPSTDPLLAPLQSHPLPSFLANWQDSENQGDYFSEIKSTPLGYLVWTEFPVKVYVESPQIDAALGQVQPRSQQWHDAVLQGVQEWQQYVPLIMVDDAELANITIWRIAPPLQVESRNFPGSTSPSGRVLRLPRVRAAETRYEFFLAAPTQSEPAIAPAPIAPAPSASITESAIALTRSTPAASSIAPATPTSIGTSPVVSSIAATPSIAATQSNPGNPTKLSHRFRILLSPSQAAIYTKSTARHELGHALGIWGHSLSETDVMYFSQVRIPPAISRRDINTLKRIYEQPTQLGWIIENPGNN